MSTPFHVIPTLTLRQSTAPARALNDTATPIAQQQLTLAAIDAPLRYGYGRARIGALVAGVVTLGTDLLLLCVHGKGPFDAVESMTIGNAAPTGGVQVTHYLGNAGQGVDPWLAAAFLAQGKSYTDTLPGIAYSVVRMPGNPDAAVDGIEFVVRMLKIYDPRGTPTTAWSENPALALADFITNAEYGRGEVIDWTSVATCADKDDELLGGAKRRTLSLVFSEARSVDEIEKALETYAGCWVVREGGMVYLVPDAPAASSASFVQANVRLDTLDIEVRNRELAPTVVTVRYTDTSVTPWAQASATVKIAGVDAGTLPYQESTVDLPGIILSGHALREAYRRLYEAQLADVGISFVTRDEGVKVRRYDVIDFTDNEGFTAKPFRVLDVSIAELGRWRVKAVEYQAGVYSDATSSPPTIGDTTLPNPNAPTPPTSVVAVEEIFQFQSFGQYGSRLKITITPNATFPYVLAYAVEVLAGTELVYRVDAPNASPAVVRTPALQEAIAYTVRVVTVSTTGARSSPITTGVTMLGKALPPGDVPRFDGFEIAGEVLLNWDQVVDIDKVRYEIRSGPTTATWATATSVAFIDSTRASIKGLAAGVTRFFIKALDSVGGYSANALTKDITITSDAGAFVLSDYRFTTITGANVTEFMPENPSGDKWYHLSNGSATAFNTLFGSALNTYTNPLASYQSSGSSEVEGITNAFDFGVQVSGNVSATWNVATLDGATRLLVGLSLDGSAYTWFEATSIKQAFRYVKLKVAATGDSIVKGLPSIRVDIVAREESGQITTLASGGKLIELANAYFAAQDIQLTPLGTAAAMAVFDDVQLTPVAARCLKFATTHTFVTNSYTYWKIESPNYVIQSGDYIEYDVYLDPANPTTSTVGFLDFDFSDATYLRGFTCNDQNGQPITGSGDIGAYAKGAWYARKAALPAGVSSKTLSHVNLVNEANTTGAYNAFYRNLRITDGASAVRHAIWTSGDPAVNAVNYSGEASAYATKPMNTFRAYAFTDAGAQSAKDVRWKFRGV